MLGGKVHPVALLTCRDLAQFAAAAAAAQGEHAPVALSVTPEEGEAISRVRVTRRAQLAIPQAHLPGLHGLLGGHPFLLCT